MDNETLHSAGLAHALATALDALGPVSVTVTAINNIWLVIDSEPGDTLVHVRQQQLSGEAAGKLVAQAFGFCDRHGLVPAAFLFSTADDGEYDRQALARAYADLADDLMMLAALVYVDGDDRPIDAQAVPLLKKAGIALHQLRGAGLTSVSG